MLDSPKTNPIISCEQLPLILHSQAPSTNLPILIKQYDYDKNGNIKGKYVSVI